VRPSGKWLPAGAIAGAFGIVSLIDQSAPDRPFINIKFHAGGVGTKPSIGFPD
jgi:hypothetical protein